MDDSYIELPNDAVQWADNFDEFRPSLAARLAAVVLYRANVFSTIASAITTARAKPFYVRLSVTQHGFLLNAVLFGVTVSIRAGGSCMASVHNFKLMPLLPNPHAMGRRLSHRDNSLCIK